MYATTRRIDKADRFDALRHDRMMVGSVLRYARTLARIGRLADKADEVLRQVDEALQAMDRIGMASLQLEAESKAPARSFLDGIAEDYKDAAEWPAWTTSEPTPLELLGIPPICGGSPEAYEPTGDDLDEYAAWSTGLTFDDHIRDIHEGYEMPGADRFTEDDARAAGLAV